MTIGTYFSAKSLWGPIPPLPLGLSWEFLMQEALACARLAKEKGEIPVGAVIVDKQGFIVASGHNESIMTHDPTAHAEIVALRKAGIAKQNYRLMDCYLVVTLEPCIMCIGAIREARLAGLVFGAYDEKSGAVSSSFEGIQNSTTWSMGGVCAEECRTLLVDFFSNKR